MRLEDYKDTEGIVDPEEDWDKDYYARCPDCGRILTPDDEGAVCEECGYEEIYDDYSKENSNGQ